MKLLGRTLVILLAALVVVGAAIAFAQSSYADALLPTGAGGEMARNGNAETTEDSQEGADTTATIGSERPVFAEGRTRPEGGMGQGLFGAVEIVKNVVIMALLVALVALASQVTRSLRHRRRAAPVA
jgi:hypothetical protein